MGDKLPVIRCIVLILAVACSARAGDTETATSTLELAKHLEEYSSVRIEPARLDDKPGIALFFEGTDDLHWYARPETAPAPGFELQAKPQSDAFDFAPPVFPKWHIITDPLGDKIEVFSGNFTVFLPMTPSKMPAPDSAKVEVAILGLACTSVQCLSPLKDKTVTTAIDWSQNETWKEITLESRAPVHAAGKSYSIWFALPLAFLAGLILNIMPCVLPVIPLKVLSIFEQAKESKARCIALGLSFCLGILLFFAAIAAVNIVLRVGYGTVFQWGDHFRNPVFIIAMSLLLVVLALFMFGAFTIMLPSAIASKDSARKGHGGSIAMGFLAAVLSTPCSFAILTTAFGWAQTQGLLVSTVAIMLIGVGMACPYVILTSMPGALKHIPKAGRWSELFKQSLGFVLLIVAVWLMLALPANRLPGTAYYAAILAFCVWMWGGWVTLMTPKRRKLIIRSVALIIAILAGAWLLPESVSLIDWQEYDRAHIQKVRDANKPVLVEFMADWCMTCKAVEKTVYSRKSVADLIERKGVVPIQADTTLKESPAAIDLVSIYNEPGVPVSILFVPGQEEPIRFHGMIIGKDLTKALEDLPDAKPKEKESE
ncbi:MAG: protein-disulfide reductase DsbD family protein [Planctomycetota bacterium]|jgi:thiol:disulfide interchange protein